MKTILKPLLFEHARRAGCAVAFCAALALASTGAFADRGRGSIRAAGHEEEHARPEEHHEEQHARPEEHHEEVHARPEERHESAGRDVRSAPRAEAPARRDWDEHDEDGRHFGGFARGVPERAFRGARFHDLPPRHFGIDFHDHHYFWDDAGIFYLQQPDGEYLVVQPPIGVDITALPEGAIAIPFGPTTYYYLDGVFYVPAGAGFAVVAPPPGIVVPTLPAGATQVVINGVVVYQFEGFNYTPSFQDGATAYTVTPA